MSFFHQYHILAICFIGLIVFASSFVIFMTRSKEQKKTERSLQELGIAKGLLQTKEDKCKEKCTFQELHQKALENLVGEKLKK